jgi:hypothetical protein
MSIYSGRFGRDIDGTGKLAIDKLMVLEFFHVPSQKSVVFKAMINSFSDQYTSEWNSESVYGRMDPISAFQGTARQISVEWDVVSASIEEAELNMKKCETLMSMLYPSYSKGGGGDSQTIASSPVFKFKFGNFAHNVEAGPDSAGSNAKTSGLIGYIGGFTFEPDFESGIVDETPGVFYPLRLTLSAEFTVLHTHMMGWSTAGATDDAQMGFGDAGSSNSFPYNAKGTARGATEAPTDDTGTTGTPGIDLPLEPVGG